MHLWMAGVLVGDDQNKGVLRNIFIKHKKRLFVTVETAFYTFVKIPYFVHSHPSTNTPDIHRCTCLSCYDGRCFDKIALLQESSYTLNTDVRELFSDRPNINNFMLLILVFYDLMQSLVKILRRNLQWLKLVSNKQIQNDIIYC